MSLILNALQKARKIAGGGGPQKAPAYLKSFGFAKDAKIAPTSKVRKILVSYVIPVVILGSIIALGVVIVINRTASSTMEVNAELLDIDAALLDDLPLPEDNPLIVDDGTPIEADGDATDDGDADLEQTDPEASAEAATADLVGADQEEQEEQEDSTQDAAAAEDAGALVADEELEQAADNTPPERAPEADLAGTTDDTRVFPVTDAAELETELEPTAPSGEVTISRPDNDPFELAIFYQRSGEYIEALQHYDEVLDADPMNAEALNNVGVIHMGTGDNLAARQYFRKAIVADGDYDMPHNNLGLLDMDEGQNLRAARAFRLALDLNPQNADAMTNLARISQNEGNNEEAIVHYLLALQIDPEKVEAHYGLGWVYDANGEVGAAIEHFSRFLELGSTLYLNYVEGVEAKLTELSETVQ